MILPFLTTIIGALLIGAGEICLSHPGWTAVLVVIAGLLHYVRDAIVEDDHYEIGYRDGYYNWKRRNRG